MLLILLYNELEISNARMYGKLHIYYFYVNTCKFDIVMYIYIAHIFCGN